MYTTELYYENSKGETISLVRPPYMMLSDTDIFSEGTEDKTITIVVSGNNTNAYLHHLTKLSDALQADIQADDWGVLWYKGWELFCRIIKCEKGTSFLTRPYSKLTCTVQIKNGIWHHPTMQYFKFSNSSIFEGKGYPYGYKYGYKSILSNNAKLTIPTQGEYNMLIAITPNTTVINPQIQIGNQMFGATTTIRPTEKLIIDTLRHKIYVRTSTNNRRNVFGDRVSDAMLGSRTYDAGDLAVIWNANIDFYVRLLEERREPRWI